ncbi:Rhomboid protease GluP [Aquisphaera giovannonii]|uniref:Rhomboid protease GluP n=1 Tax=Aquisphaera giovannonii TaxID=406548 RepID=A0A5B9W3Y2_9BACT|nr:rhomboid family intramembrane serine protease [Aquisphaera giovannonii]QEH34670.1 Rhomboid protease GluP [Aquisphaera giovannonii]
MVLPLGDLVPTRIVPVVTYAIITANVLMFLVQENLGERFTYAYACTPWEVTNGEDIDQPVEVGPPVPMRVRDPDDPTGRRILVVRQRQVIEHAPSAIPPWMTLFTCMFLHGGWMHLLGNMLYLWIVGDNVEEVLGPFLYFVVYIACGLAGSLAQIAAAPDSIIPTLGASGAIAGIMGAYVVWFPQNQMRVLLFRIITVLPAVIVIGGWIVLQIVLGAGAFGQMGKSGGVAYLAHVGGAVTGIAVALLFYNRAQYMKARDEAASGWSQYGPPDPYA